MQTIKIDGITRVEGHGKITIQLDDKGIVQDAHLHIAQFRGFEKFCEGRPFSEMPSLTARICGICPPATCSPERKLATRLWACESLRREKSCAASFTWRRWRSRMR